MKSITYFVVTTEVVLTLLGLFFLVAPLAWLPNVPDVRYTGIAILVSVVIIYFFAPAHSCAGDGSQSKKEKSSR